MVAHTLRKKPIENTWEDLFFNFAQSIYTYEKIMHIRVTEDFPERKLYWFWELIKKDKEFKTQND